MSPPRAFAFALLLAACAAPRTVPPAGPAAGADTIRIDGVARVITTDRLLDVLRPHVPALRLGLDARRPVDLPLLVVDGVRMLDPVTTLGNLPARQIHRVTTLRPAEAVARYGPAARGGAIIVDSRAAR